MKLVPADHFSLETLAEAYNQTRIDYIVPMPMNVDRLRQYAAVYDVNMASSCAAMIGDTIAGIGMLGVRGDLGWITRLGVLPSGRRMGTGRAIMEHLLAEARRHGCREVWLEVIQGNNPAHTLFKSLGFEETDELVVARRPPSYDPPPATAAERAVIKDVRTVLYEGALALAAARTGHQAWTNQTQSLHNAANVMGLIVELGDGSHGWLVFESSLLRLTRIIVEPLAGDPVLFTAAALGVLHRLYPTQDAIAENFSARSPLWSGFQEAGYFDAFRRIEMILRC